MEQMIANLITDFECGRLSRQELIRSLATVATTAAASAPASGADKKSAFKAIAVNHISYNVADYGRTRDFYADLLGMRVTNDNGSQCYLNFGKTFLIPRKGPSNGGKPFVDHIAYTLANWNEDEVKEELTRRGLNPRLDPGGPRPDGRRVNSFHIDDPDGYDVQLSGENMTAG